MIKVNVISGFLGAGKTTFIKHLAAALVESNQKVVILENEFGTVGIDGKLLELEGLSVCEISSGCICCTLKGDFMDTLIRIADEIKPDRILIEPSGIFVLSEIDDIFKNPEIYRRLSLCTTITVIDCLKFLKQRNKYTFFFENQIKCADRLVLSKTGGLSEDALINIMEELQKFKPGAFIVSGEWDAMECQDFLKLLNSQEKSQLESQPKSVKLKKLKPENIHSGHNHGKHNFTAFGLITRTKYSQSSLEKILAKLGDGSFGTILRAKGHVQGENGLLQFSYVDGSYEIMQSDQDIEPEISFIGEQLDTGRISEIFPFSA